MKNILKVFLPFFIIVIFSLPGSVNSAEYFISAQLGWEDRLVVLDEDNNDIVIQVKAILQEKNPPEINEILLLITPIAYGAADNLQLRLDKRILNGTCKDPGGVPTVHTNGVDCLDSGNFWDTTPKVFLHAQYLDAMDLRLGRDQTPDTPDDWVIYDGPLEMFPGCSKTSLINTSSSVNTLGKECVGQTLAVTIYEMEPFQRPTGLSWTAGVVNVGGLIEGATCANGSDCLSGVCSGANTCTGAHTASNQLDLTKLFYVFNKSVAPLYQEIKYDSQNVIMFNQPINTGYPMEGIHWYDAYLGTNNAEVGDSGGNVIQLKDCDPRSMVAAQADCEAATGDWFGGGVVSGNGLSLAHMQGRVNAISADEQVSGFKITQLAAGSTVANPIWHGVNFWDVAKDGADNLHLIGQYFNESSAGNPGIVHSSVVARRNICDIQGGCSASFVIPMVCSGSWGMGPAYADPGCTDPAYTVCLSSGTQCSNGFGGAPCTTGTDCWSNQCNYGTMTCY